MAAVVLIPAFEPGDTLIALIAALAGHDVVVVDDGSGRRYAEVFAEARARGAEVLTHAHNRGKGAALKTGFGYVAAYHPGRDVVCADSDGQHRPRDIEAVAARLATGGADLVLGARRFTGTVPARSRFGNTVTRAAFRLSTGRDLADTQTGLRAYPARRLPWLCAVPGARFEYEQRLLLRAVRDGWTIEEQPIATVYLAGNVSSHFRPLRDSARVYGPLLAYGASSLLAFAVDTVLFLLLTTLTGSVPAAAVTARLASATLNFAVNRRYVFRAAAPRGRAVPPGRAARRYALLVAAVLAVNVVLLTALTSAIGSVPVAKVLTEVLLLAASFLAQRHLVFASGPDPEPDTGEDPTRARPAVAAAGRA